MFNILPISQTGFHYHFIRLNSVCELSVCEFSISVHLSPPPYLLHLQDKGLHCLNQPQPNRSYKSKPYNQNVRSLQTPPATVPDEKNNLANLGF